VSGLCLTRRVADPNRPCLACAIVRGEARPPGGVVWRGEGFVVHGVADPSPLLGWLVVTSERHVPAFDDLGGDELGRLGPLAARVARAQRTALGAEHVYALALGDVLRHFHLHLVPRFADTPERLRGRRCFDAAPGEARPAEEIEGAAAAVRLVLEREGIR